MPEYQSLKEEEYHYNEDLASSEGTSLSAFQENDKRDLKREQKKYAALIELANKLRKKSPPLLQKKPIAKKPMSRFKQAGLYFSIFFGVVQSGIGSYIFAESLFSLIPGIGGIALKIASSLFTAFDVVLFFSFEVSLFREVYGLSSEQFNKESIADIYEQQIKLTTELNSLIYQPRTSDSPESKLTRAELALIIAANKDLLAKRDNRFDYPESISRKAIKWTTFGFSLLSSVANSYFLTKSFLPLIGISLGTPVAWICIGVAIAAGLLFYYAMYGRSTLSLISPESEKYNRLMDNDFPELTFTDELEQELYELAAPKPDHQESKHPDHQESKHNDKDVPIHQSPNHRNRANSLPLASELSNPAFRTTLKPLQMQGHGR